MGWFDWMWGGSASASASLNPSLGGLSSLHLSSMPVAPPPAPTYIPPPEGGHRRFKRYGGRRQRVVTLMKGKNAFSPNRRNSLNMQNDGNLVVYNDGKAVWSTNTWGKKASHAVMQPDGNLVVYDFHNRPLWASQTSGNPGAELFLQDDGNLTIFRGGDRREVTDILWSSGTIGKPNGESLALMAPPAPLYAPAPVPVSTGTPYTIVTPQQVADDSDGYDDDGIVWIDPGPPQYFDERGNRRAEREEERLARENQWRRSQGYAERRAVNNLIRHENAVDRRHDEHGNLVHAAPVYVNPSRPDPSGGYRHGPGGEPVPIHPIVPPSQPDPIVIPVSRVSNPIAPRMGGVGVITAPVIAPRETAGSASSVLDSGKSGSLESGVTSKPSPVSMPAGGGGTTSLPRASGGGAGGGGVRTGGPNEGKSGAHFTGEGLGEGELGGPSIGKRFGSHRSTIA